MPKESDLPCRKPGVNPDDWFASPTDPRYRQAKERCMMCPLYWDCGEYAIEQGVPYGVWGGMGQAERDRIWKKKGGRPTSFTDAIDANISPLLQERRDRENAA